MSVPADGKLKIRANESKQIEWQLWTTKNNVDGLKVFINDQEIYNTDGHSVDGMVFTLNKRDVQFFGKFLKINASAKIEGNPTAARWTINITKEENGKIKNTLL